MKKKISLKLFVIGGLSVFSLAILLIVYCVQTVFLADFYSSHKENAVTKVAATVSQHIGESDFKEVLFAQSMNNEVCIYVVSGNEELRSARDKSHCILYSLNYSQLQSIIGEVIESGGEKLFRNYRLSLGDGESVRTVIYGKMESGSHLVLVSSVINPLDSTLATLQDQFWVVFAVVLSATLLLGIYLSKRIVSPLKKIEKEANYLPKGQYRSSEIQTKVEEFQRLNSTLQEANEGIQKADIAKKKLLSNVSHDLRTPLTMIMGYAEMIRDFPEDDNKENAEIIRKEAERLNSLVNDLLELSSQQEGAVTLQPERASLSDFMEEIARPYETYCREENVVFTLKNSANSEAVFDRKRLGQVLYNFLNNAMINNEKEVKKITLSLQSKEEYYLIEVEDNGNGIPEEKILYIWERFYQNEEEHKRPKRGSGIGLSVARQWLEAMGLEYGVRSKLGEGSTFWVKVPKS